MRYIKMIGFLVFFAVSGSAFSDEEKDMVQKAWACEPSFGEAVSERSVNQVSVYDASIYTSPFSSEETSPLDIFQFGKCQELSNEEKMALAKALLNVYGNRSRSGFGVAVWSLGSFVSEKYHREEAAQAAELLHCGLRNCKSSDQDEAERELRAKKLEAEREQKEKAEAETAKAKGAEKLARQQQLRSGAIKPESMKDVWLANDQISSLQEIMASTLLRADNAVYGGRVIIEGEEREGVLRAKFDSDSVWDVALQNPWQVQNEATSMQGMMLIQKLSQNGTRHYAQLNLSKKTISFIRNLRIGSVVWVVGRYKANRKYKLVDRTERTMPVLDVLYIGE